MKIRSTFLYFLHVKRQWETNTEKLTEHLILLLISKIPLVLMPIVTIHVFYFGEISTFRCTVIQIELVLTWLRQTVLPSVRPCTATERLETHWNDLREIWCWEFYRKFSTHLNCGQNRTNRKTIHMDAAWLCETKESCISFQSVRKMFILKKRYFKIWF